MAIIGGLLLLIVELQQAKALTRAQLGSEAVLDPGEVGVLPGLFAEAADRRCDGRIARNAKCIRDVTQLESAAPAAKNHRHGARRTRAVVGRRDKVCTGKRSSVNSALWQSWSELDGIDSAAAWFATSRR